jgi:thiamine-monophosphate kinase
MPSPPGDEFSLIEWIRARSRASAGVPVGIGDDAALVRVDPAAGCLVTTDLLMERVHFDLSQTSPQQVGRKALAVNLSDIAAMAGRPTAAFVSVALPRQGGRRLAEELYAGLWRLAEEFGVAVAGGDTNTWDGPLVVNVALLGEPTGRGPVLRRGAMPGDWVLVTGELGGSRGGREFSFTPRIAEAQALHAAVELHAMIDVSDGIASDLRHILDESGVGAIVDGTRVTISRDVDPRLAADARLHRALTDGEDFELLLCVAPDAGERLLAQPPFATPLTHIGDITAQPGCRLQTGSGDVRELDAGGWRHGFASV